MLLVALMVIDPDQVYTPLDAINLRSRLWSDAQARVISTAQLFEALRALRRKFGAEFYDERPRAAETRPKWKR